MILLQSSLGRRFALGARKAGSPRPGQDGDPVSELAYIRSSRDVGFTEIVHTVFQPPPYGSYSANMLYDKTRVQRNPLDIYHMASHQYGI